jgi:hypothetical protein
MNQRQFAAAVGADTKWVKNAAATLRVTLEYTEVEACSLGLARAIHLGSGITLRRAYQLAQHALTMTGDGPYIISEASDGSVQALVDLARYLSTFRTRFAAAQRHQELRRGRPAKAATDPIQVARDYGIDISLLQSHLQRTPEERLRIASANADFLSRFRGSAAR